VNVAKETGDTYSLLWDRSASSVPARWHFDAMQEVIPDPIVRGNLGIEVGSGCGYDTCIMARNNPSVRLVSMDISDGVYKTGRLVAGLGNVLVMKCSALCIAAKDSTLDFAYSFGVLHHTADPEKGLCEIARVLKKGSPAFVYLYEDHSENPLKYLAIKAISAVRGLTTRMPDKLLYVLSWIASPVVFAFFTIPSKIMRNFKITKPIAAAMPFNFGTGPFSLRGDLYDRFGAPVERRFSRKGIYKLFETCGFSDVNVTRLKDTAGWVAWGHKV